MFTDAVAPTRDHRRAGRLIVDTQFDADVEAFRYEVRAYLADAMRADAVADHADARDLTGLDESFERALHADAGARGYLALTLPVEWGGGGRSPAYRAAFGLEAAAHDAPIIDTALTLGGAPILAHGSPEQRRTLLPAMARGEILLCIAYTEPGAGSDLAAVSTTAHRADPADPESDWILSGTKHLVTGAHKSDWCIVIARTDPDPAVPARQRDEHVRLRPPRHPRGRGAARPHRERLDARHDRADRSPPPGGGAARRGGPGVRPDGGGPRRRAVGLLLGRLGRAAPRRPPRPRPRGRDRRSRGARRGRPGHPGPTLDRRRASRAGSRTPWSTSRHATATRPCPPR